MKEIALIIFDTLLIILLISGMIYNAKKKRILERRRKKLSELRERITKNTRMGTRWAFLTGEERLFLINDIKDVEEQLSAMIAEEDIQKEK